jgi:DNA repair photolyase
MSKKISGTKEWSTASLNCINGCEHRCYYCYAAFRRVRRFQHCTYEEWGKEFYHVREKDLKKPAVPVDGTVMFPTTHDITPCFLDACMTMIHKQLEVGNRLLLVSKPHKECITRICTECAESKSRIMFRFTIGSTDDAILKRWEPGAPDFAERFDCLKHAFKQGFETSISCEPMLDSDGVVQLFNTLKPYITHSFWIGKMNHIDSRVHDISDEEIARIRAGQTDERIHQIYADLKDEEKVHWKESFKEVLGLELVTEAGLDV